MDPRAASETAQTPQTGAQGRRAPQRAAIDVRANLSMLALVALALALQLVGLPWLLRAWGMSALWLVVPIVVLTPTHWGLIHEAIHGQLSADRRLNEGVARALSIAFALPYDAVRFGHLMHHRFTREAFDRPDVAEAGKPRWQARLVYYARLLGGLYAGELIVPVLACLPARFARAAVQRTIAAHGPVGADVQRLFTGFASDPARRARIRRDALLTLALFALSAHLYGAAWPVLALTIYLRGVWLSLADNLPHHGVPLDMPGRARNFRVPRIWQGILMNHHLHRLHHLHPTLPWRALPALAHTLHDAERDDAREPGYFVSVLRQFSGPHAPDPTMR